MITGINVLHAGVYGNKSDSINRFYENFARLPEESAGG
jgi:UV DNA damage repair endonuclease